VSASLQAAREYLARGWQPVPVPHRAKAPTLEGWQHLRLALADLPTFFDGRATNIGLLLGALADVDLDCPEAVAAAPEFLPATDRVHGRAGNPCSHWWYERAGSRRGMAFEDHAGKNLVELRGEGQHTLVPPSIHPSGEPLTWERSGEPARVDADELERAVGRVAAVALLARSWPPAGGRHGLVLPLAGFLLGSGLEEELTIRLIECAARIARDEETRARVRDVRDTARRLEAGEPVTGGPTLAPLLANGPEVVTRLRRWLGLRAARPHLTDLGNAERFAAQHEERVRYVYAWKTWIHWDGPRWRRDPGDGVMRLAKETVRGIYAEASREPDETERKAVAAWARASEKADRVRAMLDLAKAELAITPDQLDRHPYLLNCPNGTVELRTLHLRPHRPEDYLTRMTAAPYRPEARHPVWGAYLERVMPDAALRRYVQRMAGYCLTGVTSEEKFFFVHGPTAGGKSTFLGALRKTWGDYADTADFSTFTARPRDRSPREDIARLHGARLVTSIEVDDGTRLAQGLVKTLSGGDHVVARRYYEQSFEFLPQFKLVVAANHRPKVDDDDEALWRRLAEIPFRESLPPEERDPSVKVTLMDPNQAGAAILAWAAEGAGAWFADGLGTAPEVEDATRAYREAMDPLADFFAEECRFHPDETLLAGTLRATYERWAKEHGVRRLLTAREMADRLRARGCTDRKGAQGVRLWVGVGLRTDSGGAVASGGATSGKFSHSAAHEGKDTGPDATSRHRATTHPSGDEDPPDWVTDLSDPSARLEGPA
jgi:putative DNA primase/helicase